MSTLQAGLTTDEINVALIAWYNERTGQKWPIHRIWYRDMGEEIRFAERPLDPLEDLNAMALITGAMTDEEKRLLEFHMINIWRTDGKASERMNIFMLEADAPTRAIAAVMALGLNR